MRTAGRNLKLGSVMLIVVFAVSSLALYGGAQLVKTESPPEANGPTDGGPTGGPVNVTIVARQLTFDKRLINAAPSVQVTVNFRNEDAGVLHNIAFYGARNYTSPLVVGRTFPGPGEDTVVFTSPDAPGNYPYRCDVHPDTMTGTLAVGE